MTTRVQCSADTRCSCPDPPATGVCHEHAHQSLLYRILQGQPPPQTDLHRDGEAGE
jgi:hypothetical protein